MENCFAEDIKTGLEAEFKYIPSKYLYDEKGSRLFQSIMNLDEYYPTRCEYEILKIHKETLCELFIENGSPFELIELGAGDGLKTKIILQSLVGKVKDFTYQPVDISSSILSTLTYSLKRDIPELHLNAITGDYFQALARLKRNDHTRRILLFLGSNIGNFTEAEAISFLKQLRKHLNDQDLLVIGFDLQKHPKVIATAYNDRFGVTRAFNLNILQRINRELNGSFDLSKFEHYPVYDPLSGEAKSYLVSSVTQSIYIEKLRSDFLFRSGESVHTEISKKYTLKTIEGLARVSGFHVQQNLPDSRQYFVDSVWKPS